MKRPTLTPCCSNTTAYTRDSSLPGIGFERSRSKAMWHRQLLRCPRDNVHSAGSKSNSHPAASTHSISRARPTTPPGSPRSGGGYLSVSVEQFLWHVTAVIGDLPQDGAVQP